MLALVKKPRIEISLQGDDVAGLLAWIRKKYDVEVLSVGETDESIPVEETAFWKEMEKNRVGNLLAGARLKAGLTQTELAKKVGIRQNMISDYEHGRRTYSHDMARRLSTVLEVREEQLQYRSHRSENDPPVK
ncbi:MAG: helix-turn-helix transcriptional regulator [Bacteroidetes bacterium]|nr:helix-turn-helix transcriptional regulator [Bacteroidota bacterium]